MRHLFTSESVSEGHPDKVCDRISDSVVDFMLSRDPEARVACEVFATTNRTIIGGEFRCSVPFDMDAIEDLARGAVRDIGYEQDGYHWRDMVVENLLHAQSVHIAQGVDSGAGKDEGAGDQGIMFGYACSETPQLMPAPIHYAHQILKSLAEARHGGDADILGPDSKSQITCVYEDGKPVRAASVVVSTQHSDGSEGQVRELVRAHVEKVLPAGWMCDDADFYVNPTGKFVIGGPDGDAGLTGRKSIVDTYGGAAPHGGGAFSGKDPTKVDRSAAYAARYLAKNVVAAGLAEKMCFAGLLCDWGFQNRCLFMSIRWGRGGWRMRVCGNFTAADGFIAAGIRQHLGLNAPIYAPTAAYGHFGREVG